MKRDKKFFILDTRFVLIPALYGRRRNEIFMITIYQLVELIDRKKRIFAIVLHPQGVIQIIYIISISYPLYHCIYYLWMNWNPHHPPITKKNDPVEDRKTRGILARESLLISKQRMNRN